MKVRVTWFDNKTRKVVAEGTYLGYSSLEQVIADYGGENLIEGQDFCAMPDPDHFPHSVASQTGSGAC